MTSSVSSYLELRPIRPRTEKLKQLLSEVPYKGQECEDEVMQDSVVDEQRLSIKIRGPAKVRINILCNIIMPRCACTIKGGPYAINTWFIAYG